MVKRKKGTRYSDDQRHEVLKYLGDCGSVTETAKRFRLHPSIIYAWKQRNLRAAKKPGPVTLKFGPGTMRLGEPLSQGAANGLEAVALLRQAVRRIEGDLRQGAPLRASDGLVLLALEHLTRKEA